MSTSSEADILKQLKTVHRRVALWYYLAVIYVWIVVQAGFLVLLVPKVADNYDSLDSSLPAMTQRLVMASQWMAGQRTGQSMPGWMLAVPAALVIVTVAGVLLRRLTILLALVPIVAVMALIGELFLLLAPLYQIPDSLMP